MQAKLTKSIIVSSSKASASENPGSLEALLLIMGTSIASMDTKRDRNCRLRRLRNTMIRGHQDCTADERPGSPWLIDPP